MPSSASSLDPDRYSNAQSWHLARTNDETRLTDMEFSIMAASAAFERYVVQMSRLVGGPEIGFNESVILHVVRMHERAKDASTIARYLNRDDLPNVQYALRKLVALGYIEKEKAGSATVFAVTTAGRQWTDRYAALREKLLLSQMQTTDMFGQATLATTANVIGIIGGMYDAATRAGGILNPSTLFDSD